MKALVVDSATNRLTVGAKNEDKVFISIYDIGMHQSQSLIPAIDNALKQVDLTAKDLDYTALCLGPGSFTGLRIAISALKAIELTNNVPLYGISTLDVYAQPYLGFDVPVLSCLDAKKDKYYAALFENGSKTLEDGDYETSELVAAIKKFTKVFIAGTDAKLLKDILSQEADLKGTSLFVSQVLPPPAESLFTIAEEQIKKGATPLQDYDGPVYLRASEAEVKLTSSKA